MIAGHIVESVNEKGLGSEDLLSSGCSGAGSAKIVRGRLEGSDAGSESPVDFGQACEVLAPIGCESLKIRDRFFQSNRRDSCVPEIPERVQKGASKSCILRYAGKRPGCALLERGFEDEAGAEMRQWPLRSAGPRTRAKLCSQLRKCIKAHVGRRASLGSDTTFQIRCQNVGTDKNGNGSKRVCHLLLGNQLEQTRLERVEWSGKNAMVVHESIVTDFGASKPAPYDNL